MGFFSHILCEIKEETSTRGGRSFCHENRRSNMEAHSLASLAISLLAWSHVWFLDPSKGLNIPSKFSCNE
jgi:hypothetical protein